MYDSINRSVDDTQRFARFVNVLNSGQRRAGAALPRGARPPRARTPTSSASSPPSAGGRSCRCAGATRRAAAARSPAWGSSSNPACWGRGAAGTCERHFALPEFVSRIVAARGAYVTPEAEAGPPRRHRQHGQVHALRPEPHRRRDRRDPHPARPAPCATSTRPLRNLLFVGVGLRGRLGHDRVAVRAGVVRHHDACATSSWTSSPGAGRRCGSGASGRSTSATSRARCSGRASRCRCCRS